MNFSLFHRIFAGIVFVVSSVVFLMTMAPTLSFWDCGEFITSAVTMGVPHPPGAPFFQLIGRMFSLLPIPIDLGARVNLLSAFSSSLTVLFVYLTAMRLLRTWLGEPKDMLAGLMMMISAGCGALALSFSDTFWFNASEAEVYGIGMFFISIVVWLAVEWYTHSGVLKTERTLLLIAYLMGLSIGVHLLSLLAMFFVFVLIFFRDRDVKTITAKSVALFLLAAGAGFFVVYPGIVKYIPQFLSEDAGLWLVLGIIGGSVAIIALKKYHPQLRMVLLGTLLVTLGYSTYTLVPIRAADQPALNENDPATMAKLYSYLNREQYGTYPLLKGPNFDDRTGRIDQNANKFFPRRYNPEHVEAYAKYSSDLEYFISYQFGHIYARYFLWNFVGRAGDRQDAPWVLTGDGGADWSESPGFPNRYYAIPFLLGLLGIFFHFKKDWKTGTALAVLFLATGFGLVVYFNMTEPQVRERDYFFVGSFYVFAIWIGLGTFYLANLVREKLSGNNAAAVGIAAAALLVGPGNMLVTNYQTHNRHLNYVAFDYAYNLLQSCDQDAILFTGGDNDTFPVWYLQYVAGIRRDVRVVNLSLVNTDWYAKQLKNERPYGALPVNISYSDVEIERMRPVQWERQTIPIPIDRETFDFTSLRKLPELADVFAKDSLPDFMQLTVDAMWSDAFGNKGLRNQDILIIDILTQNLSTRPIYFALSTSPGDRPGLEEHLVVEGMAYRVTPFTFRLRQDRYYATINVEETINHIMNIRTEPDSNRAHGFMFRELANPKINLDEASTRMIMSYRYMFMGLAQVIIQDNQDLDKAAQVIDQMNALMPQKYHKMDIILKSDLSAIHFMSGNRAGMEELRPDLEEYYLGILEQNISGQGSARSPYQVLLNMYEMMGEYQKGIDLLRRYDQANPNDPSVQRQIRMWEEVMAKGGNAEQSNGAAQGDESGNGADTVQ